MRKGNERFWCRRTKRAVRRGINREKIFTNKFAVSTGEVLVAP